MDTKQAADYYPDWGQYQNIKYQGSLSCQQIITVNPNKLSSNNNDNNVIMSSWSGHLKILYLAAGSDITLLQSWETL